VRRLAALVVSVGAILALTTGPAPAADRSVRIIAMGDSITYGVGTPDPDSQSWPAQIGAERVAYPGGCIVTPGCFGYPTTAVEVYPSMVLAKDPDIVFIAYGVNDLVWSPARRIMAGLRQIVRMNEARCIPTLVATLTPLRAGHGLEPYRADLNRRIHNFGDRVVDFDAALAAPDGTLPPIYDSGDGLHPNPAAYEVMANVARAAIDLEVCK
jgi:lysophospholipase L1-like esterase